MNECMEDSYPCQGSQRSCISSSCSVKLTLDSIWEAYESRSFRQHQAEVDAKFRVEDEDASELKYDVIDR